MNKKSPPAHARGEPCYRTGLQVGSVEPLVETGNDMPTLALPWRATAIERPTTPLLFGCGELLWVAHADLDGAIARIFSFGQCQGENSVFVFSRNLVILNIRR